MKQLGFIIFVGIILLSGCSKSIDQSLYPIKGRADYSSVTIEGVDHISLEGEWEFYWSQLLTPTDFGKGNIPTPHYMQVPGSWTANPDTEGNLHPAEGQATFRLVAQFNNPIEKPGILIPNIWGANKVWINGSLVYQLGDLNNKERGSYIGVIEAVRPFTMSGNQLEIIIQISNYNFFLSGIKETIYLGTYEGVSNRQALINASNLLWLGVLIIMAIYHFVLWFFRKKTKSTLYFGIICTIMAIKLIDFGDHYLYEYYVRYYKAFVTGMQPKIYYLTIFTVVPVGLLYVESLYPKEANRKWINIMVIVAFTYSAIAMLLPLDSMFSITPILVGATAIFALYIVYILVRAALHKRPESTYQMIGVSIIVIAAINDILHTQGIGGGAESELIPIGFGVFLIIQLFVLSYRFAVAFNKVEDLSENLERKVEQRTEELSLSNKNLQKAYDNITNSVRYASRIQEAMLDTGKQITKQFPNSFIFFRPRDIVSGDFYWYAFKDNKKIVVVADCTGHGVPGAFMTIVGQQILDEVINEYNVVEPSDILHRIDQRLVNLLYKENHTGHGRRTKDGMDIVILVFDEQQGVVSYAGAKNSLCYVTFNENSQREIHRIKGSKFPIESVPAQVPKVFDTHEIQLRHGDVFYLFSDGFQDQFGGAAGRKYMSANFRKLLLEISDLPMKKQHEKIAEEFDQWKGKHPQTDDVIVVGIEY